MSDLKFTVEVVGAKDLEKLDQTVEHFGKTVVNVQGAGRILASLRSAVASLRNSGSDIASLRGEMGKLSEATDGVERAVRAGFSGLARSLRQELEVMRAALATSAMDMHGAVSKPMVKELEDTEKVVTTRMRSIAQKAKAEATKAYQAMVMQNPNAKVTTAGMEALFQFESQGATLSPYHKSILANWKKSSNETYKALQAQIRAENKQIRDTVAAEEASLQAALKAMEQRDTARSASLASIYRESLSRGKFEISRVKAGLKEQADEIIRANRAENLRIQSSVAAATNASTSPFQRYNASTGVAGGMVNVTTKDISNVNNLSSALDKLSISGNNAHSMARGLASGFNMLWLTWGNLAPLLAGAAISNGFVQTAKSGMEVAHTLAIVENLGGNTAAEMQRLEERLISIGRSGPFGPKAVAEAMQTLSLAGLKANEILVATQDVLNFSVSGTTSIQTAADTLVSVSTAFNMGAAGFGRVADVISKAAAESKTSVESFSGAMKTASVVNAQYGVSLEDTATAIATMSQLGIEASAAGTAFRNMYADLSGRSAKVAKLLRAQGIEMRTATGEFKPMIEVVADLDAHLRSLDGISQKNLLQALLSERGAKGLIEMLRLVRTEAKDSSKGVSNALEEVRSSIENSYGFAAQNAAKLGQTVDSQFKAVSATLQTSMFEAYKAAEPSLYLIANGLKEAFASPEFIAGLTSLVTNVAEFGSALVKVGTVMVENQGIVLTAVAAYAALRSAQTLAALATGGMAAATSLAQRSLTGNTAALAADTLATQANTAANAANAASNAGRLGALGALARFLPGIGTALTIVSLGWAAVEFWQSRANDTAKAADELYNNNVVKSLNDQADKLAKLNALRSTGITLTEAQSRLDAQEKTKEASAMGRKAYEQAQKEADTARSELEKRQRAWESANPGAPAGSEPIWLSKLKQNLVQKSTASLEAFKVMRATELETAKALDRLADEQRKRDKWMTDDLKARNEAVKAFGTGHFEQGAGGSSGGRERANLDRDNELKALQASYDAQISITQDAYNRRKRILDAERSGELLSEQEYANASYTLTQTFEAKQIQLLEQSSRDYLEVYRRRQENLKQELAKATKDNTKSSIAEQMEREQNDAKAQMAKNAATIAKIQSEASERIEISYIKLASAGAKLVKEDNEFWKERSRGVAREREADRLAQAYDNINKSVFSTASAEAARAKAMLKASEDANEHLVALDKQLQIQTEILQAQTWELDISAQNANLTAEELKTLEEKVKKTREFVALLQKQRATSQDSAEQDARDRGDIAYNRERKAQETKLAEELADISLTALKGKWKEAGSSLRAMLKRELLVEPLTVALKGVFTQAIGGMASSAVGALTGISSGSGGSGALGLLNNGASLMGLSGSISAGVTAGLQGWAGTLGLSSAGTTVGGSISAGWTAIQAGNVAGGLGTLAGVAMPVLGAVALLSSMDFGSRGPHHSGGAFSTATKDYDRTLSLALGVDKSGNTLGDFTSRKSEAITESLAETIRAFSTMYKGFEKVTKTPLRQLDISAAFSTNPSYTDEGAMGWFQLTDKLTGELVQRYKNRDLSSDTEKASSEYFGMLGASLIAEVQKAGVSKWADEIFDTLKSKPTIESLNEVMSQVATIGTGFLELATAMEMFENITGETETALLKAAGSIDNLKTYAGAFYSGFYSEQERMMRLSDNIKTSLSGIGYDIDPRWIDSKETFRKAVEDAMSSGKSEVAVALMAMSENFATAADYVKNAANAAAESMVKLYTDLASLEDRFGKTEIARSYRAEIAASKVESILSKVGIQKDVGTLRDLFLKSDNKQIEEYFREAWAVLDTTEAKQELVDVANSLLDLNKAADSTSDNLSKLANTLSNNVSSALDAMDRAGSLLDQIDAAKGGSGNTYSLLKEQRLWAAIAKGDYKQQITLAEQLSETVLARYDVEKQAAEKQLDFAKSLKNYVDSLKIGNLSPLTTGEKLAEAASQYRDTFEKAKAGDEAAQSSLQSAASSYLELARTYFASSDDYTEIFRSVTGGLESLGVSAKSQAEQQLSISAESLTKLNNLQDILENAYAEAGMDYASQKTLLEQQLEALAKTSEGMEKVRELTQGLPAEIAANLNYIFAAQNEKAAEAIYNVGQVNAELYQLTTSQFAEVTAESYAALQSAVVQLQAEIQGLRADQQTGSNMVATATMQASQANASQVVTGVSNALSNSAYYQKLQQGATLA